MPLFICSKCGCCENTALTPHYWGAKIKLCSECATGKWHGKFEKEKATPEKWEKDEGDFIRPKN